MPHRNVFAHLEVIPIYDLPKEDRKKLVFKKYTNGVLKPKKYTIDDIVDLQVKMEYVDFSLDVILQELPPYLANLALCDDYSKLLCTRERVRLHEALLLH